MHLASLTWHSFAHTFGDLSETGAKQQQTAVFQAMVRVQSATNEQKVTLRRQMYNPLEVVAAFDIKKLVEEYL